MTQSLARTATSAFVVAIVILIIISVISYVSFNRMDESLKWVRHTHEVLTEVDAFSLGMTRAVAARRGRVLYNEDKFLTEFDSAEVQIYAAEHRIEELTTDNAPQQKNIRELNGLANDFLRALKIAMIDKVNTRVTGDALERVGQKLDEMKAEELRLLKERHEVADSTFTFSSWVVSIGRIMSIVMLIAAVIALNRDIAARQNVERALRESEERIRQLLVTTAEARDAAMESARLKSEFLANMSHEIRTPLNGVIGMSELLLSSALPKREREYALIVRNSSESLLTILNDILDISKIEAGKMMIESTTFNLQNVVEEVGMLIAAPASERKLELIVRYSNVLPRYFSGDPVRIRQVLSNLAGNAVKFTKEGHVLISADLVSSSAGKSTIRIAVKDTGIGIPPDYQSKLFQKFTQADASTTRQYGGTGLGLAISNNLVEMMGGKIKVQSDVGKGTEFSFELCLPECETPKRASEDVSPAKLEQLRCLIVDDNAVNRKVLAEVLDGWHVPSVAVDSASAALAELAAAAEAGKPYAVVLMDYQMPQMDGEQLAGRIKADARISNAVLFLLSSVGQAVSHAELKKLGIASMLLKPVRQSELFEALQLAAKAVERGMPGLSSKALPAITDSNLPMAPLSLNVLLVEDNEINRKVAQGMLQRLACTIEMAGDGAEAVTKLNSRTFDVVLMDCQMPVMDGYEATREIRRLERERGGKNRIPIVAMTANAMKGDRDRCLDSGMDGYISKPVHLGDLTLELQRVLRPDLPSRPLQTAVESKSETSGLQAFNRVQAAKNVLGDLALLKEVLGIFFSDIPPRIEKLKLAVEGKDLLTASREAHSIKGAAGNVGAERIHDLATRIESASRTESEEIAPLVAVLELELPALRKAVEEYTELA